MENRGRVRREEGEKRQRGGERRQREGRKKRIIETNINPGYTG